MSGVWSGVTGTELQISCSDPRTGSRQRVRISPSVPITPVTLRCQRSNAIHRSRGCILWMSWLMRRSVKATAGWVCSAHDTWSKARFYPERLRSRGIEWCLPAARDRDLVNRIIFDELVFSRITRQAKEHFMRIIETFKSAHQCDAVVLGCTEIPFVVTPEASPLPTLDSTRLLARAALKLECG